MNADLIRGANSLYAETIGRATETLPADRERAEEALSFLYLKQVGKIPKFIWVDGPVSGWSQVQKEGTDALNNWAFYLEHIFNSHSQIVREQTNSTLRRTLRIGDDNRFAPSPLRSLSSFPSSQDYPGRSPIFRPWIISHNYLPSAYEVLVADILEIEWPDPKEQVQLHAAATVAMNCYAYHPHEDVCIIFEYPEIIDTEQVNINFLRRDGSTSGTLLQLHNEEGPSLKFRDGVKVYSIHGINVPEYVVMRPEEITLARVLHQNNTEVRRIMMDRLNFEHTIEEHKRGVIDGTSIFQRGTDACGSLWDIRFPSEQRTRGREERITIVKVINGSPEPDGTYKNYYLRVPTHVRTPHEAVAWTFGLEPEEYQPSKET